MIKDILSGLGTFTLWLLWPDTYACVIVRRLYGACPPEERETVFRLIASCENVNELDGIARVLCHHWGSP